MPPLRWFQRLHSGLQMIVGFSILITLGTGLLLLPMSTPTDKTLSFTDAVFTATSAVCVTGLIVVQTPWHFTWFGEFVIMMLFQLGGIGIILGSTMILMGIQGSMGLEQRFALQQSFMNWPYPRIKHAFTRVFILFFTVEVTGAAILSFRFMETMNVPKAFWHGLFHSISAVCNAGFSLNPDSIVGYRHDPIVVITMAGLIMFGGIGFVVIAEIIERTAQGAKFSLHTKTMLFGTIMLVVAGMVFFIIVEPRAGWLDGFFQSVTARTAGFNSVELNSWGTSSILVLMFLMFVGAGPASTAGGIKITTFVVTLADIVSRMKQREHVHWLNRRLPQSLVNNSIVLVACAVFLVGSLTLLLTITEPASLEVVAFEVFSALGTVGLSLGITSELSWTGKWIIILAMFLGRLGPLTFALLIIRQREPTFTYPQERMMIG